MRGGSLKRKGSMQLSIEAIIILVIAFTLLGFGIVFVKNVFTKAGGSVDNQLGQATSVCNTATASNPISPGEFQLRKDGTSKQDVCVYNNAATPISGKLVTADCYDTKGAPVEPDTLQFIAAPLTIERGEAKTLKTSVRHDASKDPDGELGTYICNVYFKDATDTTGTKQVGPIQMTFEVQ